MVEAATITLASAAYRRIREDIILGRLAAGQRLHIQGLSAELNIGASPLREALNRLVSERLVTQHDQRGFRVVALDLASLDDLFNARCWINEAALRSSIALGGSDWEEGLVLALHRLRAQPRLVDVGSGLRGAAWESAHDRFHEALVEGCGSDWMRDFCRQTSHAAVRYRVAARSLTRGQRTDDDEHHAIAEAALARDADQAAALLIGHFRRTQAIVTRALSR